MIIWDASNNICNEANPLFEEGNYAYYERAIYRSDHSGATSQKVCTSRVWRLGFDTRSSMNEDEGNK
jgi:hypothetical protein